MILPIGPIHPYLKEPIRLKLQTEGERVVKAEIEYGYVHRGIEKIIEGKRGPTGGYKLLKDPKDITLHDLYRILDEDEKVIDCNENNGQNDNCCEEQDCKGGCIWGQLDAAMTKILENTTLEDLVKNNQIIE